ncbi:AAA family ATPase [Robiginitalea marina]|uniref:AAA family ATPase n=1 Tax=Robiginitalea marina TaxID=2954105 RepID=A0ABT1B282_9FLAO|nr:AAA family ATPase [Robiginitalea marina]MCO5725533.1 AAA family ATPase [Robiginitalea marina]
MTIKNFNALNDSEYRDFIKDLNEKVSRSKLQTSLGLILSILIYTAILINALLYGQDHIPIIIAVSIILLVPIYFWNKWLSKKDRIRKTVRLWYDDEDLKRTSKKLGEAIIPLKKSNKKWQVVLSEVVNNTKYHAGAATLVDRKAISGVFLKASPYDYLQTNVYIPAISFSHVEIFFLPDRLLLKRNNRFAALSYNSLYADSFNSNFRESDNVPKDAEILDYTYLYVNKSGGPDRRFNHNPRIPICLYSEYTFQAKDNLNLTIMTSKAGAMDELISVIEDIAERKETPLLFSNKLSSSDEVFTREYHNLLKSVSKDIESLILKLNRDKSLLDNISTPEGDDRSKLIPICVYFDLAQTIKLLYSNNFNETGVEMLGLLLMSHIVMEGNEYLEKDYEFIVNLFKNEMFEPVLKSIANTARLENPIKASISGPEGEIDDQNIDKNFALPGILKILNHSSFDEYVTVIYRFATIIAKSDGIIEKEEENKLKQIYQTLHYPLGEDRDTTYKISETKEDETLDDVVRELDKLIGLDEIKGEIKTLINFIEVQKARSKKGLKVPNISYHMVFTGSPGTGKTTVARIVGKVYKHLGILKKGHLIETDRSGLIAGFVGQTSSKVNRVVDKALDGVLFIDEAYSLTKKDGQNDYGAEAVATLLKRMEDERDRLAVIVAGYPNEMGSFIESNPGLESRFNRYLHFQDYSPEELFRIFELISKNSEYSVSDMARKKLHILFQKLIEEKDYNFGNGRVSRNIFEQTIENQSNRIAGSKHLTKQILITIESEDIPEYESIYN